MKSRSLNQSVTVSYFTLSVWPSLTFWLKLTPQKNLQQSHRFWRKLQANVPVLHNISSVTRFCFPKDYTQWEDLLFCCNLSLTHGSEFYHARVSSLELLLLVYDMCFKHSETVHNTGFIGNTQYVFLVSGKHHMLDSVPSRTNCLFQNCISLY